jgi:hypothetical protein
MVEFFNSLVEKLPFFQDAEIYESVDMNAGKQIAI